MGQSKPPKNDASAIKTGQATAATEVAERLRRDILLGLLKPGEPITERDNAERLGISRTPFREGIRILAKEGLVTLRPLRSPIVTALTLDEVLEELVVLHHLERLSGDLACEHATAAEIEMIGSFERRVAEGYYSEDKIDVFALDMKIHHGFAQASHNRALIRSHHEYLARLWQIRFISARRRQEGERVLDDHKNMVEALKTRDPIKLKKHIDIHFAGITRDITNHFEASDQALNEGDSEMPHQD